jgi:two-component system sensor histidine kinase RegB
MVERTAVEIVISDDGPGIAPDILKRIGEPYLARRRTRPKRAFRARARRFHRPHPAGADRRKGVVHQPHLFPDHGAVVQIVWPREAVSKARKSAARL